MCIRDSLNGEFVNLSGSNAFYGFTDANTFDEEYIPDPTLPLLVGFDFNYDPQVAVIAQEVPDWIDKEGDEPRKRLIVFDELWLHNCDTDMKCEQITEKYGDSFTYHIYPDSTFKNRTAHGVGKSDLILVRNSFKEYNHRLFYHSVNPRRSDSLNDVNSKICNSEKERFILIHKKCKHIIEDLRKILREEYLNGNYKDSERGHILDALRYIVSFKYPIRRTINHNNNEIIKHL
jgi:hypothetical protein